MSRLETLSRAAIVFIGFVAVVFALVQVESIFAPMCLALVAGAVLSPVSDTWEKMGFSPVWGALTSLFFMLLVIAVLVMVFHPLLVQLVDQAPKVWSDMQDTVDMFRQSMSNLQAMGDQISEAVSASGQNGAAAAAGAAGEEAAKAGAEGEGEGMSMPGVTDALMLAPAVIAQFLIFIGTLFFFLLTRNNIYAWAAKHLAEPADRAGMARRLTRAERKVSGYFLAITVINAGLGLATGVVMSIIGMPGAILWGLVAFLINFILYIGPAVLMVSLLFAGVAAYDGVWSLLPAACYICLNATEGQFVTPALIGKHMQLNPLLVFLALVFGIWLWGPIGGIVAIPVLLWVLVLADAMPDGSRMQEMLRASSAGD